MKLHEVVHLGDLTYMFEGFNKVIPYKLARQQNFKDIKGKWFAIETNPEIKAVINITPFQDLIIGEVGFYTEDTGHSLLNVFNAGQVGSLIATIKYICLSEEDVTTWFFSAKFDNTHPNPEEAQEELERRKTFYFKLAWRFSKEHNLFYAVFDLGVNAFYILSKTKITSERLAAFKKLYE